MQGIFMYRYIGACWCCDLLDPIVRTALMYVARTLYPRLIHLVIRFVRRVIYNEPAETWFDSFLFITQEFPKFSAQLFFLAQQIYYIYNVDSDTN